MKRVGKDLYIFVSVVLIFLLAVQAEAQQTVSIEEIKISLYIESLEKGEFFVDDELSAGGRIYFNPKEIICTYKDIDSVKMVIGELTGIPAIEVYLNAQATLALAKVSEENIGKRIIIMANNQLLNAPYIQNALTFGRFSVVKGLEVEEVERLLQGIKQSIYQGAKMPTAELTWERPQKFYEAFALLDSALLLKDERALYHLLHKDLRFTHSNGWIQTKRELLTDLKKEKISYKKIDLIEIDDTQHLENMVAVRRISSLTVEYLKDVFDIQLSILEVWTNDSGKWQLWIRQETQIK